MKIILACVLLMTIMGTLMGMRGSPKLHSVNSSPARMDIPYLWRYGGPYGYYCGLGHTSRLFVRPINNVDRACQVHDSCISAAGKYLDCFCNEQLLVNIYNVCPVDDSSAYYRSQIITAMNIGTSNCNSLCDFRNVYPLSAEAGYNGAPFYEAGSYTITIPEDENSLGVVMFTHDELTAFAIDNIQNPHGEIYKKNKTYRPLAPGVHQVYLPGDMTMIVIRPADYTIGCELAGCDKKSNALEVVQSKELLKTGTIYVRVVPQNSSN